MLSSSAFLRGRDSSFTHRRAPKPHPRFACVRVGAEGSRGKNRSPHGFSAENGQRELRTGPTIRSAVFIPISEVWELIRLLILRRRAGSWFSQACDVEEGTHVVLAEWALMGLEGHKIWVGELGL